MVLMHIINYHPYGYLEVSYRVGTSPLDTLSAQVDELQLNPGMTGTIGILNLDL